jgi:ATP-dependent helicase/nuclease subunit B
VTIQLLVAPARGGKTAHVIDAIRALPPLAPAHVLVPDRIGAIAFRRRLAQAGGALGVEVQTFYALYAEILSLAASLSPPRSPDAEGEGLARLPSATRFRLIRFLAGVLGDAGLLSYYAPVCRSSGFARLVGQLIEELKRARIFPDDLERALAGGAPRLAELARLYATYQAWLIGTGWVDSEGQGWLASIALEREPQLLSGLALLAVDGFDEFNPTQLHLLRLLADRAEATLVTLTSDPQHPDRLAHRRFARARALLTGTLSIEPTSLPPGSPPPQSSQPPSRGRPSPPLVHLEQNLFEPLAPLAPASDAVQFLEAQNRAAEAREALRWLKARVVRDGVPLSDVAVVARDVLPYRPFLEEVAAEFGMPLRFSAGAALRANPAIAALENLLTLSLEEVDWSLRPLLDALSSPYFDWTAYGLRPEDPGRMLDVARAGQVIGGLDQWREAFQLRQSATQEITEDESEGITPRRPPAGAEAARLADVIDAIVARVTPPPRATPRDWVAWIESLIGPDPTQEDSLRPDDEMSLHVVARAHANPGTAERDVAALRALKDVLRGLVLANSVLDRDIVVSRDEFLAELTQAIQDATYTRPVEGDAIWVVSALEARGLAFDSVALLGLAEGDFPAAEREDALLRESDREWLAQQGFPIESRLRGDEAALFYQAVTRARRRLLLCRPYLAEDGQSWEPSPYWSAARKLFQDAPVRHVRPTDAVDDPASEQERQSAWPDDAFRVPVEILRARSQAIPSPWTGDLSALHERFVERFGSDQPWSSSRLETYAKCPFYFWAAYAMELEPRDLPQAGFDVLVLGSIYHVVLERLYAQVPDGDPDRLRAELPPVAQEVYAGAPKTYGFRPTPLWERQQEEMTEVLHHTLDALIDAASDYAPLEQELPFGLRGRSPLILPGRGSAPPMKLRGYIDRVDRAPDGRLRVIDYKAGSTRISARDLADGHRLQLPLYALAAERALGAEVASGFYWHISSARSSSLRLEEVEGGVVGAVETATEYALAIGEAVCAGQFPPTPTDEGCPSFCPAAAFCEHYRPRAW